MTNDTDILGAAEGFSLLLEGEYAAAFTPKWLAMLGTGRAGTKRAAESGAAETRDSHYCLAMTNVF